VSYTTQVLRPLPINIPRYNVSVGRKSSPCIL